MPGTELPTHGSTGIVVADPTDPAAFAERIREVAGNTPLAPLALVRSSADIDDGALGADVLVGPPQLVASLVPQLPALRWVQSTWAGVAPVLEAIASHPNRQLQLTAAKGLFGPRMAEYVFGWLLTLERRLADYRAQQRTRTWATLPWTDLQGSTMLLLGTGSIGTHIAGVAHGFGMNTLGVSRRGAPVAGIARTFAVDRLLEVLGEADYVVASLPDTPDTRELLNAAAFRALRDHAILINVGRGTLIEEQALLDALAAGQLRAAVIDVFAEEPLPSAHRFWSTEGLYLTPHIAAVTPEEGIAALFVDNYRRYLAAAPLAARVDTQLGY
ncbi:MAG: D-2-hydroxyacid dehydrogenase [Pseudomonadota bacterium]